MSPFRIRHRAWQATWRINEILGRQPQGQLALQIDPRARCRPSRIDQARTRVVAFQDPEGRNIIAQCGSTGTTGTTRNKTIPSQSPGGAAYFAPPGLPVIFSTTCDSFPSLTPLGYDLPPYRAQANAAQPQPRNVGHRACNFNLSERLH